MDAEVTRTFRGVADGKTVVQEFKPGDTITGELGQAMVDAGYARKCGEKAAQPAANKAKKSAPRNKAARSNQDSAGS